MTDKKQLSYVAIKLDDYTWKLCEEWKEVCDYAENILPILVFVEGAGMIAIDSEDELQFQRERGPVIDMGDLEEMSDATLEELEGLWFIPNENKVN
jgi:hypothetical protein